MRACMCVCVRARACVSHLFLEELQQLLRQHHEGLTSIKDLTLVHLSLFGRQTCAAHSQVKTQRSYPCRVRSGIVSLPVIACRTVAPWRNSQRSMCKKDPPLSCSASCCSLYVSKRSHRP